MKILGTGLSGMVGTRVVELLSGKYSFEDLSLDTGVDIRDRGQVFEKVKASNATVILHAAAKTNVDGCEEDLLKDLEKSKLQTSNFKQNPISNIQKLKRLDWKEWRKVNSAFAVNVVGTANIVCACKEFNKKLIYVSTDFVFDGAQKAPYTEKDNPNPINHYSWTKYIGEQAVESILDNYIIVRLAFPYGSTHPTRKDFVRRIASLLKEGKLVKGVTDNTFTPTLLDDIADALDVLFSKDAQGIYHVCGSEYLSPYEAAVAIAKHFGYDKDLIRPSQAEIFYKNHAPRPAHLALNNKKISDLGVTMKGFAQGLMELMTF